MDTDKFVQAVLDQLRAEMAAANVSGRQLSDLAGVPYETLIRYLRGDRQMPLTFLVRSITALGIEPERFFIRASERASDVN